MTKKIVAQKTTLAELYRLHGRANIKACSNGAVYRRDKASGNWVFLFVSEEQIALTGGAK